MNRLVKCCRSFFFFFCRPRFIFGEWKRNGGSVLYTNISMLRDCTIPTDNENVPSGAFSEFLFLAC